MTRCLAIVALLALFALALWQPAPAATEFDSPLYPHHAYLPGLSVYTARQGTAGAASAARLAAVDATWYQRWFLCSDNEPDCISAQKGDEAADGWSVTDLDHAAERCTGGYLLIGDEYEIRGWALNRQARFLRRVENIVNGRCKIVWGGVNVALPADCEWPGGAAWVRDFDAAYRALYHQKPRIAGVHFNAYWWTADTDLVPAVEQTCDVVRAVYPGAECWLREFGSLMGHDQALHAISLLPQIAPHVDRYAYFLPRDGSGQWDALFLFGDDGTLTDIGAAYRDWQ